MLQGKTPRAMLSRDWPKVMSCAFARASVKATSNAGAAQVVLPRMGQNKVAAIMLITETVLGLPQSRHCVIGFEDYPVSVYNGLSHGSFELIWG